MIRYHEDKNVLELSLVDLEHCGFDVGLLVGELLALGIRHPDAVWPTAILVQFAGGCAFESETITEEQLAARREARSAFAVLRARVLS